MVPEYFELTNLWILADSSLCSSISHHLQTTFKVLRNTASPKILVTNGLYQTNIKLVLVINGE